MCLTVFGESPVAVGYPQVGTPTGYHGYRYLTKEWQDHEDPRIPGKRTVPKIWRARARGRVAVTPDEAVAAAETLGAFPVVVKAQIHAGGRGKGGGVKLAGSADEVRSVADDIIGMNLVTHQTGPEGREVKKVLVEQGLNIAKELYLSIIPDRATAMMVIMASEAGGMDIETVAEETPEKIIKVYVDPLAGISPTIAGRRPSV